MTPTDIGILLIVLCVLLWAILAALHRQTVQLNALRKEVEELLRKFGPDWAEGSCATRDEFASRDPAGQIANRIFRVSRKF